MRLHSIVSSILVRPLLPIFLFAAVRIAPAQTAPSTVNFRFQTGCCGDGNPNGVTTGDFNEDGRVDVAVIDESDFIWVMQNDGAFHFSIATNFTILLGAAIYLSFFAILRAPGE
jgi:hypothetical protein